MPARLPFISRRAVITTGLGLTVAVLFVTVVVPWWTTARRQPTPSALRAQLFQQDAGMVAVQAAHLVQDLDLRQTIHDVTVTLHQVYADEHRLIFGLTTNHPHAQYLAAVRAVKLGPDMARLTEGVFTTRSLYHGACGWNYPSLPPCSETGTLFTIHLSDDPPALAALRAATVSDTAPSLIVDFQVVVQAHVQHTDQQPDQDVAPSVGPFHFDFRVPVTRAQRVEVHQTVHAAGVMVTLADLAITPSMARVQLCFDPLDQRSVWQPHVELVASSGQRLENGGGPGNPHPACFTAQGYGIGGDPSGRWTVTVTELEGETQTIPGPWTFAVTIP